MKSLEDIKSEYPLHWLVWNNDVDGLRDILQSEKVNYNENCFLNQTRSRAPYLKNKQYFSICINYRTERYDSSSLHIAAENVISLLFKYFVYIY